MRIIRLFGAPAMVALAFLFLVAPRVNAQRVRQFFPGQPRVFSNTMSLPSNVSVSPRIISPPFYSTLAARNPFLLSTGFYNPTFTNLAYGGYVPSYSRMYGYGGYGYPYMGYGYGGYGMGYGYGYPSMGYGYGGYGSGYNPALYSGGYGYGYGSGLYSSGYTPGYSSGYSSGNGGYQSSYKSSNGSGYQSGSGSKYGQYPNQASLATGTADVTLLDHTIAQKEVTIAAGTRVIWTNRSNVLRQLFADDDSWNSPTLSRDQSFTLQFVQPGTYKYHCRPDADTMKGTIIVK